MFKQDTSNTAQAVWIGVGSLFSFLFSIVSAAILSRYLSKADYGTYKQVMYVYTTLLSVFTLGLPLAYSYFLPRVSLEEGKDLVRKLNTCFFVLGLAFSLSLFLGADMFGRILNNPNLSRNIKIFSPAPIFILPTMGLPGILATYKQTIWNAVYVVLTRVMMLLFVALPVALYKASVDVALWGFIVSSFISWILAFVFINIPFRQIRKCPTQITYKSVFAYSIPLMVAGFLGVAISAADQFYVSRFFGQEIFADFANGSLELPFVSMVLSAGSTVLLPVFSKMISENTPTKSILDLWERTAVKAAYVLYPMIVYCLFFAPEIMTFLYGDLYESSSVYFQIMLFANFFSVIQFYPIILALGKTKEYALAHIGVLFLVWGFEFFVVKYLQTAIAVTAVSSMCKIIKMFLMMKIVADTIGIKVISLFPIKKLSVTALSCFIAGFVSFLVSRLVSSTNLVVLIVGLLVFIPVTFGLGFVLKIDYLSVIRPVTDKYLKRDS